MTRRAFFTPCPSGFLFWMVDLEGCRTLIRSGILKESLHITEKTWLSPALAEQAVEEWIADKIQEGYQENLDPVFAPPLPGPAGHSPQSHSDMASDRPAVPLERSLTLKSTDWVNVPWMVHHPVPDPAPAPFDREDCVDRLTRSFRDSNFDQHSWSITPIPSNPSRPEAVFWLRVMELLRSHPWRKVPAAAREIETNGTLTVTELVNLLERSHFIRPQYHFQCMAASLASKEEFLKALMEDAFERVGSRGASVSVLQEFFDEMLPRLTCEEVRSFRQLAGHHIRSLLNSLDVPEGFCGSSWPTAVWLGGILACQEMMDAVVRLVPDEHYANDEFIFDCAARHGTRILIAALGCRQRILEETRRMGIGSRCTEDTNAWLALTEWHGLNLIADSAAQASKKTEAASVASPLLGVVAPEAAPVALRLILESKAGHIGVRWLNAHPLHAIAGLTPVAAGQGKLAAAALEHLRNMRRTGGQSLLEKALPHLTPDQAGFLRLAVLEAHDELLPELMSEETPPALLQALETVESSPRPGWVTLISLPPIRVNGARVGEDALRRLVTELKQSPAGVPGPICRALRQTADPLSLDAFAWELFEIWLKAGSLSKEKWAYHATGHLGGDRTALKLTPLIREWPTLGQQKRAAQGLELLRAIGTDTALTQLHGIARKVKSMPLKKAARQLMELVAGDRGLTTEELEDRIVPDAGLNAAGTREFDFGPRRFTVFLRPDLKPAFRDEAGRLRPELPEPNAADDPIKASAAKAACQLFRKNLTQIVRTQTARLEQALVTSRRWEPGTFLTFIAGHPILTQLGRKLIWAGFTPAGDLLSTFRITQERTLADIEDRPWTLPAGCRIGPAHPALLTPADLIAWAAVLHDYELIQPFPQLQRPVLRLPEETTEKEVASGTWTQGKNRAIPIRSLLGFFDKQAWTCLRPDDSHIALHHCKSFIGPFITAVIRHDPGVWDRGDIDSMEDQEISALFFVRSIPDAVTVEQLPRIPLNEVDPVTLSEVLLGIGSLPSAIRTT